MRILFSTTPLDGHFRPMIPLARALRAAGHELAFATEAWWHPHVVAEGFDALPAGRPHADALEHLERFRDELHALPPERRRPSSSRTSSPSLTRRRSCRSCSRSRAPGARTPSRGRRAGGDAHGALWRSVGAEPDDHAGAFRGLYIDVCPPSFAWEQPWETPSGSGPPLRRLTVLSTGWTRSTAAGVRDPQRPEELTKEAVQVALRRVLDAPQSFAGAAHVVQAEISAMPTIEDVASRLEDYVVAG